MEKLFLPGPRGFPRGGEKGREYFCIYHLRNVQEGNPPYSQPGLMMYFTVCLLFLSSFSTTHSVQLPLSTRVISLSVHQEDILNFNFPCLTLRSHKTFIHCKGVHLFPCLLVCPLVFSLPIFPHPEFVL